MRFLYFTDSHIRGTNPKSRKDDFLDTLKNKLEEILRISKERKVDYLLHGGDLFDRPDVSISVLNDLAGILNGFPVPLFIISGNHDIYGHNPETLHRSILGLLNSLAIVQVINNKKILLEEGDLKVQLSGAPYRMGMDEDSQKASYILRDRPQEVDYAIHLVHGFLMDKKFMEGIPHTLISEVLETQADLTLSGHYHHGFKTQEIEGKVFANPGAIVRISNSLTELKRRPKVLLIEVTKKGGLQIEEVFLKSALPGKDVLDREEIDRHRFKRVELEEFKGLINRSGDFKKMDIIDLVMEISKSQHISQEVRDEALKRITQTQIEEGF
ncbi:MAG: metallophosphoesterase family protein [Tissierellia bacterium]|nr:metallophosphoesterase family protein [Tissierellia bacterium]